MTDFAAGLATGFGLAVLLVVALAALALSLTDRHGPELLDDPYQALYAAATRPVLHATPLEVHDVA